jgi:thioredoxin 1
MAEVLEINDKNFETEISKSDKPALVDFWAPWCGPCRMMHPVIEGLAEELSGKAVIARCNVDENQALAQKFGVTAIPTMIIFKNGEKSETMIGVTSAEEIKKKLDSE